MTEGAFPSPERGAPRGTDAEDAQPTDKDAPPRRSAFTVIAAVDRDPFDKWYDRRGGPETACG